jgi:outer membrane protein
MKKITRIARLFVLLSLAYTQFCFAGDFYPKGSPGTPPSPSQPWKPSEEILKQFRLPEIPTLTPDLANRQVWTLEQLVDVALQSNSRTKVTWLGALAAAAHYGSINSAYYPSVDVWADLTTIKGSAVGGQFTFEQTSTTPTAALNYVIYDFGKRKGDSEEARQELIAANFSHDAAIQDVILQVQSAYFLFVNAKALATAQKGAVERSQADLDAAEQRHQAGVATIADVLQAKTQLSQAQLELNRTEGTIQILRGTLAVAIGVPASAAHLDVAEELPENPPTDSVSQTVEDLVRNAIAQRPDLAAARSVAQAARAHITAVKGENLPEISANGDVSRVHYWDTSTSVNTYSAQLFITFPLFNGFARKYDIREAKNLADQQDANVVVQSQLAGLEVWNDYFALQTAAVNIQTVKDLLASAQQSYDVANGRYKEGVGSILDLLAAQNALQDAVAQDVQTRTNWYLALAQLTHDTGTLWKGSLGEKP